MHKSSVSPSKSKTRGRTKTDRPRARAAGAGAKEAAPQGEADPARAGGARVIRRYGNRRLYDARLRRCVTMEEIGDFVRGGEDVRVVDAESGADITRRVLVQLILEDQNRQQLELLPVPLLRALLGARAGDASGWLEQYLKTGSDWLERATKQAAPIMSGWSWPMPGFGVPGFGAAPGPVGPVPPSPPPPMSNTPPAAPVEPPQREPRAAAAAPDEAAELRRRLDEMQRQLEGLAARAKRR